MSRKILIANRGEIAVRIIRACREMGIRAVAVHSAADAGAYWTRLADQTVEIGPAPARLSYLDIAAIIKAAKATGADAVHPGYGLLSESAAFARAVADAGLVFIGPRPDTIALMGDKVTARAAAIASGVPVLPGSDGPVTDAGEALKIAARLGWPVAVKASHGGGGRGLRVVHSAAGLAEGLAQAARESQAAFGSAEIFLERYLVRPRHVEVQILADAHGNVVALGDRDCSVQRRHQKLLEEAPAPDLNAALRDRIHQAAIRLSRDTRYAGAGTVEFLVDRANDSFYFLEMNTRLQVEHGVTELVTGVDIVREQIAIAQGAALSIAQESIAIRGYAIQARLTAENPWQGFRAEPGRIDRLDLPGGPHVRCDFGVQAGDVVPVHYDSLYGKVHAWAPTRDEARRRLAMALAQTRITGVPDMACYLRSVIDQPDFAAASHDTESLERDWMPDTADEPLRSEPGHDMIPQGPTVARREVRVPWGTRSIVVAIHGTNRQTSAASASASGEEQSSVRPADDTIAAPMDGIVVAINCQPGQIVRRGESLLLLEAMKMEVAIAAPRDGVVEKILVEAGAVIRAGDVLAHLLPA